MPLIPLLFFVTVLTIIFIPAPEKQGSDNKPTPSSSSEDFNNTSLNPDLVKDTHEAEIEESLEDFDGFLKLELLPDGTKLYTYSSPVPNRPNIIISEGEEVVLFQRNITHPKFPVKITNYINVYGPAKWIFKGSNFYGAEAQAHIYPERGVAFIANPKTGEVLEQHLYDPTKVEDYISKFGDDIPAQP